MTTHDRIESQRLADLEVEWNQLLRQCLEECARGRLGLFASGPEWPEAERARSLAHEIVAKHAAFGSTRPVCELFLHYCSLRHGHNVRGEPQMAAEFLEELKDLGDIR
jgi:hypothetical protein